jgi:Flp pilus assembly protein TadG
MMLISVSLVVVLGMAALAVDVGNLWTARRRMQNAADAAAMAGVDAISVGETGSSVTDAAQDAAAQNGFTNGSTTTTSTSPVSVAVYNPPTSGFYQGLSTAVQVVVSQPQPTYFMRVLGWTQVPVSTTATALAIGSGSCIFGLDPSATGAITIDGTASLTSSCGVYDNSSSSTAYTVSGGGTVSSTFIGVVGGTNVNGGGVTPTTTGIPHFGDPLAWVTQPSSSSYSCSNYKATDLTNAGTVSPGTFCGGIKITGGTVNFSPGLYIIDGGGIQITGGTITGNGVTFFLTGANNQNGAPSSYGGVQINSTSTVNLSAPCVATGGGQTLGMLFFQDRTITNGVGSVINGSSASTYNGALYFPTTSLSYSGNSSQGGYTLLVADTLTINGTTNLGNDESACMGNNGPMIKDATLVE